MHAACPFVIVRVHFARTLQAGNEGGGIIRGAGWMTGVTKVPTITVDALVERYHLSVIDVLSVDTEGNDPEVLQVTWLFAAARQLLSASPCECGCRVPWESCPGGLCAI